MNKLIRVTAFLAAVASMPVFAAAEASTVTLGNGEEFTVIVAGPASSDRGILLVHDWFGVSPFYREAVNKFAAEGYRVIAVDLYNGESATSHADAWKLMQALDAEAAAAKIDRALEILRADERRVAIMGFSMGAAHAFKAALRNVSVGATVIWYGDTVNDVDALQALNGPVLAVYGSKDGPGADNAATFSKAADGAGKLGEIWVYPGAHHAFAQPLFNQGKTYDAVAAAAAWRLTLGFLARQFEAG